VVRCFNCNKVGHKQYDCLNNKTKERKDGNKTEANKKGDNRKELRKKEDKSSSFKRSKGSSRVTALSASSNSDAWYIDSGATTHMTNRKVWLDNYSDCGSKEIRIANGDKLHGFGQGNVVKTSDNSECGVINHITYVPKLSTNLLSVITMVRRGMIVNFSSKGCQIFSESNCNIEGDVLASTLEIDGMYRLCLEREIAHVTVERQMQVLWHKRLGHLSLNGMKQLREEIAKHLDFSDQYIQPCVSCIQGKKTRLFLRIKAKQQQASLSLYTDICGPMNTELWNGSKYLLTFIDDFT
jgi:hypothetical protein